VGSNPTVSATHWSI